MRRGAEHSMDKHNLTDTSATAHRAVASGPLVRRYLCTGFAAIPVEIRSYVEATSPEEALQLANTQAKFGRREIKKEWIVPNSEDKDSAVSFEFSEAEIQPDVTAQP